MSTTEIPANVDIATFTVNGEEIKVPKGANLLRTLLSAGYEIPHYCYHPSLSVAGNCRLCFVQMEGDPRLHASCNMKTADGLKILTDTPAIKEARAGMMEFLLVNHPLDCPVCDKGGECQLQRYSMDHGITEARTEDERRRYAKPQFDPLIDLERNRCILCSRCVRFCDEQAENHVLGIVERGDRNRISSFGDGPISSIFSGNVVDLCPVGALTSKPFRFRARTWELQQIVTSCTYCSVGCSMTAWPRNGQILRVTTPVVRKGAEFGPNEDATEFICNQGRYGSDFGHSESRILSAQVRKNGTLVNVSLNEGIESAAQALKSVAEKHGPQSIGFIAGPRATNEELYLLQLIARDAIGTSNIDWRVHLNSAASCNAHFAALAAADGTLADLEKVDCVLVIEADLLNATPILALRVKEAAKNRKNKTVQLGSVNDAFISKYAAASVTAPTESVYSLLEQIISGEASTNGDAELNALLETLSSAQSGMIVYGLSEQSGAELPQLVSLILRLRERLGGGWKTLPVAAERNAIGAFAMGCQPDRQTGAPASESNGLTAPEMIAAAAEGKIKALYILGQDLLRLAPNREQLNKALDSVEALIVHDAFPGFASSRASIVLPGALFTEKDGTYTNVDGQFARLVKGYDAPDGVLPETTVLQRLGNALGHRLAFDSMDAIFSAYLSMLRPDMPFTFSDLMLDQPGDEWPVRVDHFRNESTRPQFWVRFAEKSVIKDTAPIASSAPLGKGLLPRWSWNVAGGDHLGDQSPTMTRLRPQSPFVYCNSETAGELGLQDKQNVTVSASGANGISVAAILRVDDHVAAGLLHFAINDFPAELTKQPLVISPAAE